ncbi:vesicle-associated membrane protein 4-like [Corticium candelabrum]|uniref:vesicle-associated membrane protein 4-like n=1 Tax=Corticium candelabrum TaxID=121492 RepID=UPI002E26CD98|nr:vesicle-associated membrane protein 4-like [Corticium candelabrum]XP_062515905.1 vesicle-associated membrane protein 4-like [Corticium candelabrum]
MPPKFARRPNDPEKRELLTLQTSSDEEGMSGHGRSVPPRRGDRAVKKVQQQLDDVVDIMHKNIERVVERGEKLEDLQDKSEDLVDSAAAFRTQARRIQRQMWWKRCRMRLILAAIVAAIILIIVVPIVVKQLRSSK